MDADIGPDARMAALKSSAIFQSLQPDDLKAVLAHAVLRQYPRGTAVLRKGDPGRGMLLIMRGQMRISSMLEDGREVTLGVVGPGEAIGEMSLLDGQERSADVTALDDCAALVMERGQFLRLLRGSPDLCLSLIEMLSQRLRQANTAIEDIALLDLSARLGKLLLRLARDCGAPAVGGGVRIELKLSQKDLSTLVGASREKVNRQLRQWEEGGILSKERGYLVIRQPAALLNAEGEP